MATQRIPFFVTKWAKVIFYISILILKIVFTKPRRLFRKFLSGFEQKFEEENVKGHIVLVTGGNSGIGKELTLEFAKRGSTVIMACRNLEAAKEAIVEIRNQTFLGKLVPMKLDLASLDSIRTFAGQVEEKFDKIDILILNAGVLVPDEKNEKTVDGFEVNFGVNHLGHFLLTNLLLKLLKRAQSARVVSVSSIVMKYGKIDFEYPMKANGKSPYFCCPSLSYANSKYAQALFSHELARRLQGTNVRSYCLCPGIAVTSIDRDVSQGPFPKFIQKIIKQWVFLSPQKASKTVLYCALGTECSRQSGELYRRCKLWDTTTKYFPDDLLLHGNVPYFKDEDAQKLWILSKKLVGLAND